MMMPKDEFERLFAEIDNSFIGSHEHVYNYQKPLANFFVHAPGVVADIACGQGAFLQALKEAGVTCVGVDIDKTNVATCRDKDLPCIHADAFEYLKNQFRGLGGISMFHFIEHFEARQVVELFVLAHEALKGGGIIAIVTPDFEKVGLHNFWLSSTHKRPYPKLWIENALEKIGFSLIDSGELEGGDIFVVGEKA